MEKEKFIREEALDIVNYLNNSVWRLKGMAGLFFPTEEREQKVLECDVLLGISFLLEEIAQDIKETVERVENMLIKKAG